MRSVMGPLPPHSWTLPNFKLIESQVLSKKMLDTLPIFDWQVSLAYATTFLCILLPRYIFKLIPCSDLSFRGPNLGLHHIGKAWNAIVMLLIIRKSDLSDTIKQEFVAIYSTVSVEF